MNSTHAARHSTWLCLVKLLSYTTRAINPEYHSAIIYPNQCTFGYSLTKFYSQKTLMRR